MTAVEAVRNDLLQIYQTALQSVNGRERVRAALGHSAAGAPLQTIAIGKAAIEMMQGAHDALGESLQRGLVITRFDLINAGHGLPQQVTVQGSGHPLPDEHSLAAGAAVCRFLDDAPAGARFLFLISGGTSSLVEVPAPGVALADLARANAWLLGSGLAIDAINRVRTRLSRIKGGGLCHWLAGRPAQVLLLADVPGDDPAAIGSGLLVPTRREQPRPALPGWLQGSLQPARRAVGCGTAVHRVIAGIGTAMASAALAATERGYTVYPSERRLAGPAISEAAEIVARLTAGPPGIYIRGGETTVELPPRPGRGGRNQHLALAAALDLDGCIDKVLLACGTDGSDGSTDDAGGLVDGTTVARISDAGLNARQCLAQADAGTALAAAGDLVSTGPTGTNVADLVIAAKWVG